MTIEQKRRELFEREYCGRHGCSVNSMMKSGKMYLNSRAQNAWYWFNAALDAVVIQLPRPISAHNTDANGFVNPVAVEYDECIEDCRDAIESTGLGLKVTP